MARKLRDGILHPLLKVSSGKVIQGVRYHINYQAPSSIYLGAIVKMMETFPMASLYAIFHHFCAFSSYTHPSYGCGNGAPGTDGFSEILSSCTFDERMEQVCLVCLSIHNFLQRQSMMYSFIYSPGTTLFLTRRKSTKYVLSSNKHNSLPFSPRAVI